MSIEKRLDREKIISRLDGFVSGAATFSGNLRDYTSYSYVIEHEAGNFSIEQAIRGVYHWLPSLEFSVPEPLGGGLRELETAIRPFLVRDVSHASAEKLIDLQKYLSFRVMEQISSALDMDRDVEVVKLSKVPEPSKSDVVYFCIRTKDFLIVLQFNEDIEFKKGLRAPP